MQNYIASLLADVAYLDLNTTNFINGKLTNAGAQARGFNQQDRLYFNEHFTIIDQSTPDGLLSSGFSASTILCVSAIVENNKIIMENNSISITYRGTESVGDFVTDLELALRSSAALLASADDVMKRLIFGDLGTVEIAIFLDKLTSFDNSKYISIMKRQREDALNYFKNVTAISPSEQVNVYGHSLGGYLANYVTTVNNNYQRIKETVTFNAPGFDRNQLELINIIQKIETLIKDPQNETYKEVIQNALKSIIESSEGLFNINSLEKMHSIYSTTGMEFTTSDQLGMFHPELRIPLYTDDAGMIDNHYVRYLRESLCVYDSLSCLMPGTEIQNYEKITELLSGYVKDIGLDSEFRIISNTLKHIATFLGLSSSAGITVLSFINSLSVNDIMNYHVNKTSDHSSTDVLSSDGAAILYSLMNYVPFTITGTENIIDELYNPDNYTKYHIDSRFDLFNKLISLKNNEVNNSEITQFKDYKIFYSKDTNENIVYIDTYNNLMYTNDLSLLFNGAASIIKNDLKTIYFKNDKTLIVTTFNNIVHDYYGDDYIHLNKGETTLDLSYGSDTVSIDVAAGATIKDLTIKDDGLGDLFIFNGGVNDDRVQGTKYTDKIFGDAGNDGLFGGDGDDTINGGLGNDMIFGENGDDILSGGDGNDMLMGGSGSNSLSGGDGDDILNAFNTLNEYHDIRGDRLDGGTGKNTLIGTGYGDRYVYSGGFDTIYEKDKNFGVNYVDKLIFSSNIQTNQVSLYNSLNNLVIAINGIWQIFVIDYYNNNYSYLDEIQFTNPISGDKTIWDTNYILQHTVNPPDSNMIIGSDNTDTITGTDTDNVIDGRDGNDVINGGKGNDIIYGGNGNDILNGGIGNDEIHGGAGDDILNGNEGNDIIYGDVGNDTLTGGSGSDKYHYTLGDGNDIINETSASISDIDKLYLHNINPDDVEIYRKGANYNDIFITIKTTGEYIIVKNYYQSSGTVKYLDEIVFDNGITWQNDKIIEQAQHYRGTEANDTINISNSLINVIDSGGGNDRITNSIKGTTINSGDGGDIISSTGNDATIKSENDGDNITVSGTNIIVESGSGADVIYSTMNGSINAGLDNDNLYLGSLKETIIYNIGDGQDRVNTTGAGGDVFNITGYNKIDINNIFLSGQGKIVELRFNETDSITLNNYINLLANVNNSMTFIFDNGSITSNELKDLYTIINKAEIADNKFYDTIFSDQITGTNGDDNINIINGNGGSGFDTVNSGDGVDTINNRIANTVINAGNDGDIIYTTGKNVTINGDSGTDRMYTSNADDSGYLNGGEGDDYISIYMHTIKTSNHIIEGGTGNDTIFMSKGTETIIYNKDDGSDTINIAGDNSTSQNDKLVIKGYSKNDITANNFILYDDGRSVILNLNGTDNIKLVNFLSGKIASNNLKYFEFDDGILTNQELIEKITHIKGTKTNDIIYDTAFDDTIEMIYGGSDTVYLKSGNDTLTTGTEKTLVRVESSYNTIHSGRGNDSIHINKDSITTLNLNSSNNGHDSIGFAYLNTIGIVYVNLNTTVNIADTSVKGDYYKFSWDNDSSLSFQSKYLNNKIIFNYKDINLDDINLVGDDGDNYLSAISSKGQTIYGNGGVDTIYGSINNDIIHGGLGNDKIYGQEGNDTLYGDDGDDTIIDVKGSNTVYGGVGNDTIIVGAGENTVYGGDGNDYIEIYFASDGADVVYGGDGNDTITGTASYGEFYGQNGDDTYNIYNGKVDDYFGNNILIISNYSSGDIRKTSNGFQAFNGDQVLVDYTGFANIIQIQSLTGNGYKYIQSLVGTEINKLFELQAALAHEIDTDNSAQKINELKSQMNYLWRSDTQ